MRAIVYGQENTFKKLAKSLNSEGIEVKKVGNNFYTTGNIQADEKYDIAFVDSRSDSADEACRYIRENWDIPVVLVVDSLQANWKGLIPLDADGYIPEVKKGGELSARARALLRRLFLKNKSREKTPEKKRQVPDSEDCMCMV